MCMHVCVRAWAQFHVHAPFTHANAWVDGGCAMWALGWLWGPDMCLVPMCDHMRMHVCTHNVGLAAGGYPLVPPWIHACTCGYMCMDVYMWAYVGGYMCQDVPSSCVHARELACQLSGCMHECGPVGVHHAHPCARMYHPPACVCVIWQSQI